jgi:hypothetical protein
MEKLGIPSVPMATKSFADLAKSNASKRGMPHIRACFTPHPVWGKTAEQLMAYVEGDDPVSGKPLMKEIIDGLTVPLSADDTKTGMMEVNVGPPVYGPDTLDNLQRHFLDNGMTDFLPVIIPTPEKVEAMLKGTSHHPDEVIGKMAAGAYAAWSYNVRQVAVNAVMAGCEPEYFPVVLAVAASGMAALGSSTTSFAYSMVINGPIRDKLNMNYTIGAMGPFAQPNAAIGRAWTLLGKNLGNGGIPGDTYMGSQGNNTNYNNIVIAENEKDSSWSPYHVQKGFKPEENVVSLFAGEDIRQGHGARRAGVLENPMFDDQISDIFRTLTSQFDALVICDPLTIKRLVEQGYDTKEKLQQWLWKNTTRTAKDYRDSAFVYTFHYPRALRGEEPYKTWYNCPEDTQIPYWPKPDNIVLVCAGGQTNPFFQVGNLTYRTSVLVDKWM